MELPIKSIDFAVEYIKLLLLCRNQINVVFKKKNRTQTFFINKEWYNWPYVVKYYGKNFTDGTMHVESATSDTERFFWSL